MDKCIFGKITACAINQSVQSVLSGSLAKPKIKLTSSGNRSFNTDFIKFGFHSCGTNEIVQPQCVICGKILANKSLKPSKSHN